MIRKPQGILNPKTAASAFQIVRLQPSSGLASFVEHYWIVRWDRRDQEPYTQDVLIYPCVNLVFEKGLTAVHGPRTAKYSRVITGAGQVLGIKFRPAGFYPFVKAPMSRFTNRSIDLCDALNFDSSDLEATILAQTDMEVMVDLAEEFLRSFQPAADDNLTLVHQIIDCIIDNRSITKVDDLLSHFSLHKRTMQRVFSQHVGVSPKWVIMRYRLHEAADQLAHLAEGSTADLSKLAVDLGYFDQAHFIKDFKVIVGSTPAEYARAAGHSE